MQRRILPWSRYVVILKETGEVSDIKLMEGDVEPKINTDVIDKYDVEEVDGGVKIDMFRGGPVHSVAGFGYPEGYTGPAPTGGGITRVSATRDDRKPVSHEKQRGTEPQDEAGESEGQARPQAKAAGAEDAGDDEQIAFDEMTVEELRDYARDNEIGLHGAGTKAEIVKEIKKAERAKARDAA